MEKSFRPIPALSSEARRKFLSRVSTTPDANGCTAWTATMHPKGYGQSVVKGARRPMYAHRIAYFIATGKDPAELCVCHTCDNPSCCNPDHLFLGTNAENTADREIKGRTVRGETHGRAKFKVPDIIDIRAMRANGSRIKEICEKYNVGKAIVSLIVNRRRWQHVA